MVESTTYKTFWLFLTNAGLAAVILVCCFVIGNSLVRDLIGAFLRKGSRSIVPDDHSFIEPRLGLTMADGGERIDTASKR